MDSGGSASLHHRLISVSPPGCKQLVTIADLLAGTARAEHPDYEPDLNFKKAKAEKHGEQPELL
jgi:hypothetical protein